MVKVIPIQQFLKQTTIANKTTDNSAIHDNNSIEFNLLEKIHPHLISAMLMSFYQNKRIVEKEKENRSKSV